MNIQNPGELAAAAGRDFQECYGDDLVSVALYGSAAGGDFNARQSDINLLIVLKALSVPLLEKSAAIQKKWMAKRFARPLFMGEEFIAQSLDVFPIEFWNIKACHKSITGKDIFSAMPIALRHLRLQAEREIKGKQLHLYQHWLQARQSKKEAAQLVAVSLKDFSPVFRALLALRKKEVPGDRTLLFSAVEQEFGLGDQPFSSISTAVNDKDPGMVVSLFPAYFEGVRQLARIIDKEELSQEVI
ncbi:MAG: hypothetical protein A2350_12885 [Candidatus Raymondbacteria bacterium RifOxyB12_full_50_8]|uniref:Polymerase nucleotidyl transferase domain-containing protein n=1 Tax=Candidatus Raymondbacteria bacterium RIFOXYD12_FULL_49_13 TaxID=1817890 RepID=A0A1F7F0F6_UNCRA|nr:MAG: hypothetical protein A2248_21650 [Candidatus Raymondbacteria bacterium RIFOXYA2_FULL_49_16]OGK00043.1 MAG: hypothetical protein A2519_22205 [Candidatus Raymondbacteria bacterium RIFOXYD12_FULL_49_13]OGK03660.1 MAG: hypothetical protein A2350_12885 [Candidatus Raymondbacteria bacterium RifOxyB12_full_50_8]OGP45032.1 MAG: hypothetical protein A2324_13530 [Candidatus Raymondbacteria bacterium RIFOXYB2_FULL_49_35]